MSARKDNSDWIVDSDISYFRPSYTQLCRVKIVAETGALEDFKVTLGPCSSRIEEIQVDVSAILL
jgi:hypothetical protein